MPRANRHFLTGYIWHITHRCHKQEFLLKFARDRRRWMAWLYEARKRFRLCVLNYVVTSNHIHLLVRDDGRGEIARSMQLVAGRTGQEYNRRKGRRGAFWEDRYHATAVDTEDYLARCLVYLDLNMVRAGVVSHPAQWEAGGFREIQNPSTRYRIVDLTALMELLGIKSMLQLQLTHRRWIEEALQVRHDTREGIWSESLAVGREAFVEAVKAQLGVSGRYRRIQKSDGVHSLKESAVMYQVHFEP